VNLDDGSLPGTGQSSRIAAAVESPPAARSSAPLLVLVASEPAPSPVTVTEAPRGRPGYARCMALRPDASGGSTWTQATVSSGGGPELALVMLGSKFPWRERGLMP
jgi:hypothetical protein